MPLHSLTLWPFLPFIIFLELSDGILNPNTPNKLICKVSLQASKRYVQILFRIMKVSIDKHEHFAY